MFHNLQDTLFNKHKMPSPVKDKAGKPIEHGDHVWTRIRGGRREGDVEQVATTDQEAKDANIKNPPKVSSN